MTACPSWKPSLALWVTALWTPWLPSPPSQNSRTQPSSMCRLAAQSSCDSGVLLAETACNGHPAIPHLGYLTRKHFYSTNGLIESWKLNSFHLNSALCKNIINESISPLTLGRWGTTRSDTSPPFQSISLVAF